MIKIFKNFPYHKSSKRKFLLENRRGLRAVGTDNLPKRSVGCPWIEIVVQDSSKSLNWEGVPCSFAYFSLRSEVTELLKSWRAGISDETFTCKPRTFLVMLECFWEYNTNNYRFDCEFVLK